MTAGALAPGADAASAALLDLVARTSSTWMLTAALAMARPLGAALAFPLFTRVSLGTPLLSAVAFAIALPTMPVLEAAILGGALGGSSTLVLLGFKEMAAGLLLGTLFAAPFWALQSAGELLDQQRGTPQAGGQSEPGAGGQVSPTGNLLLTAAMAVFALSGGLREFSDAIYRSLLLWPVSQGMPQLAPGFARTALGILDDVLRRAVLVAAPVLVGMGLADLSVILLARSVPKLGVYDLSATVRNAVFLLTMVLYAVFLPDYVRADMAGLRGTVLRLGALLR